jgi:hypothetical protein
MLRSSVGLNNRSLSLTQFFGLQRRVINTLTVYIVGTFEEFVCTPADKQEVDR